MRIIFKTSYLQDIQLFKDRYQLGRYLMLLALGIALPFMLDEYYLGEATYVLIFALAGLGLMLLVGHTGQVSLGHAAFLAVGAYSCVIYEGYGVPFLVALPLAGLTAAVAGAVIAVPVIRLTGIYLAIATLALAIIVEDLIVLLEPITGGVIGLYAEGITVGSFSFERYEFPHRFYWLCLTILVLVTLGYANLLRSPTGRAFMAIRDSEVSAQAMGVNIARYKTLSFALSCGVTGLAGGLLAHYLGAFNHETFLIITSIHLLMMIVIGGLGSIQGAYFGAIVIGVLPSVVTIARESVSTWWEGINHIAGLDTGLFSALLVLFILYEPLGIYGRWMKIKTFIELFPLYRRNMFKRQHAYLKTERMR